MSGKGSLRRADFDAITQWIAPRSHVLDLGCGDGLLLRHLHDQRAVTGYGVEIEDARVLACVENGVAVIQSDLERGLSSFGDRSFDYVILSLTLQAMRASDRIIGEMLRVGREGIVTFPNFGYWKNRVQLAAGRMPRTANLPYEWFDTPNIHLCTLEDFERFCSGHGVRVLERVVMNDAARVTLLPNLRGNLAIYRFTRA